MPLGSGIEKNQKDLVLGESRVLQGDPFPEGLDAGHLLGSLPWWPHFFICPTHPPNPSKQGGASPTHLHYPFARMKSDNHTALRNIMFTEFFYILQI